MTNIESRVISLSERLRGSANSANSLCNNSDRSLEPAVPSSAIHSTNDGH